MKLFHTSDRVIEHPDIHYGRKNADFGQGFYLSTDEEFSRRWAAREAFINVYELDTGALTGHWFERDADWFRYIFRNRRGRFITGAEEDPFASFDYLCGPIANDTIYDTMGIITSGFLSEEEAMKVLLIGPCYEQLVLRSGRAAECLSWQGAFHLGDEEIAKYREIVKREEEAYQATFAKAMKEISA